MHGRDFKPSGDRLLEISSTALRAGIERDYPDLIPQIDVTECVLAYYGDLNNAVLAESGKHYDESLDVGDRLQALAALQEIRERKRFGIRQYDRLPGKSALGEFVADMTAPVLGALGLWPWVCRRKARDFSEYLRGKSNYASAVRERVRSRLMDALASGDRVMLISHGTGSVVAWDVLWELSHDKVYRERLGEHKVELWTTLGSPLGDSYVKRRIAGAKHKLPEKFPTNVISWHNVAAEDDYTCHDETLANDFRKMMRDRYVSTVTDYKIYNHAVRYGKSNPHSSVGYYIHPRISKIVADWLQSPPPLDISSDKH